MKVIKNLLFRQSYEYQSIPMNDIEMSESLELSMIQAEQNRKTTLERRIEIIKQSTEKDECGLNGYLYLTVVCCCIIIFCLIQIYRTLPN